METLEHAITLVPGPGLTTLAVAMIFLLLTVDIT